MEQTFSFSNITHMLQTFFVLLSYTSEMSRLNFSPIIVIKVMISGIAFDHSNYLSCLRAFLYDHFKFYMIVPIKRNE